MTSGRRLTGCATSDHPDPAVAVGEVVGRLQNSLAGSPQFALVLIDLRLGSLLSTIASAVHGLLGPDLALAVAGPHVAGADHLAPTRAAVVVWALCGVDVAAVDGDLSTPATRPASVLTMHQSGDPESDGAVTAEFDAGPDAPRPLFVAGDGRRWRPPRAAVVLPAGSAQVVRGVGERAVGPAMVVTDAQGRTLRRLEHVPARAVLVDQLETTDAFLDGPSPEFPPLRVAIRRPLEADGAARTIDVVAVDPDDGSIELSADIEVGDRVQLLTDDPDAASRAVFDRLVGTERSGDRAVLLDGDLTSARGGEVGGEVEGIPTAAVQNMAAGRAPGPAGRRARIELSALSVHIVDEDCP